MPTREIIVQRADLARCTISAKMENHGSYGVQTALNDPSPVTSFG